MTPPYGEVRRTVRLWPRFMGGPADGRPLPRWALDKFTVKVLDESEEFIGAREACGYVNEMKDRPLYQRRRDEVLYSRRRFCVVEGTTHHMKTIEVVMWAVEGLSEHECRFMLFDRLTVGLFTLGSPD